MPPFLIPILLLIPVIILPSAGVLAAYVGGWKKLAKVYPLQTSYEGNTVVGSGGMGIANYGYSLVLGGNAMGFYLYVTPWLRLGHTPLFIPWEDITAEEVQGAFYSRLLLSFKNCPGIYLRMPKKDALKVRDMPGCEKAFKGIFQG
jgi:hypothetical protein